jgi:cytochrome c-type biogenesis protein CcmH/NrfG
MRAAPTAMLVIGFGIGFGLMYSYISPKAADIIKPIPQFVPQRAAAAPQADPAVIRELEGALKTDPKNFEALRDLGDIRYDERNFREASALYARALEVHPDDVDVRAYRAGALLQDQRVDEALSELDKVLSKDPTHAQGLFLKGVALFRGKSDREGALAAWNKLVQSHPELPEMDLVKQQIKELEDSTRRK